MDDEMRLCECVCACASVVVCVEWNRIEEVGV